MVRNPRRPLLKSMLGLPLSLLLATPISQAGRSCSDLFAHKHKISSSTRLAFSSLSNGNGSTGSDPIPKLRLVLDLDEALVHSTFDDVVLGNSHLPTGSVMLQCTDGLPFVMRKRPGLHEYLSELTQFADVYMYTAGMKSYAQNAALHLDPTSTIFRKIWYRDSCVKFKHPRSGMLYTKDLRKLGLDYIPERTVLIDNSILSFICQPSNGLHIPDFIGDQSDNILSYVLRFLKEELQHERDIRPILEKKFNLHPQVQKIIPADLLKQLQG